MRIFNRKPIGLIFHCVLGLFALLACRADAQNISTKTARTTEMTLTTSSTYPVNFASPRRDCAIPATTSAKGAIAWSHETGKTASANWPPAILIWGSHVLVTTFADMVLFDRSGKILWEKGKQGGTPAAVANGLVYYKNKTLFLDAVNLNNEAVLQQAPFPSAMSKDVVVHILWPGDKDFIAAVYWPGEAEVADGDDPDTKLRPPEVTGVRNAYGTTYREWGATYKGPPRLLPLLLPELNRLVLVTDEVIRLDVAGEKELSRFKLPLGEVVDWSVDSREIYYLTSYEAKNKVLLALSAEGRELWRWTDKDHPDDPWARRQPPIQAWQGRIQVLTERWVLTLKEGKLLWAIETKGETIRHGSALADGSLLVTAGKTLSHIDVDGRKFFSVQLDKDILSPPVVDAEGNIYVATESHLVQIH
ncbi:MAG: hypothetical protein V2B19_13585 [Pseudomonadota bacterium]